MPNMGLMYALSAGAKSMRIFDQSASSSSASSIGRDVVTPWPISERSTITSTLSSGLMRSHALGVKGAAGVGPNRAPAGIWKPMTRPAPATAAVSRNSRRVTLVEARTLRLLRRAMDGGADSLVGAAAADVRHRGVDVGVRGVRVLRQQRSGGHDLARLAVPALRDVLRDPGALHRVRAVLGKAFDRGDALAGDRRHGQHAGARRNAVQVHGAGAALRDAAPELGAGESERVAQHPQQRGVGRDVHGGALAVHGETDGSHAEGPPQREWVKRAAPSRGREGAAGSPFATSRPMASSRPVSESSPSRVTYARRLGLFSGTMAVIGGIIGGGIFLTPATVAERVGSAPLIIVAWVVGGVVALVGALCFGELGARRPKAGGGYVYLREAWGPLPAFLYGWALLFLMATGAIVFLTGLNYVGVKPAAVTQNIFTVLKLAALAALIMAGLSAVSFTALDRPPPPSAAAHVAVTLGAALVPILFTYGGWQQTNFIAEEIIEPERNLPRALVLGVAVVVVVYLLANVAYLRVLGPGGLAATSAPAAAVMRAVLGPAGGTVIAAGIAASTFGFLNLVILVTPRVFQAMAADGVFFSRLAELHPIYRTPTAAIVLQGGWAVVLTLFYGTFSQLVDYVAFGDWIFFGLTVAGLFVYRARERAGTVASAPQRGFRTPGYPWTPALFVVAALYVVASSILANPRNALIGTLLLLVGVPVYRLFARRRAPGAP